MVDPDNADASRSRTVRQPTERSVRVTSPCRNGCFGGSMRGRQPFGFFGPGCRKGAGGGLTLPRFRLHLLAAQGAAGAVPVGWPADHTGLPLTKTCSMPAAGSVGSAKVARSMTVSGSNTVRSA